MRKPTPQERFRGELPFTAAELEGAVAPARALKLLADAIASATHAERVDAALNRRDVLGRALAGGPGEGRVAQGPDSSKAPSALSDYSPKVRNVIDSRLGADSMSPYERARWDELQEHWDKKAKGRQLLPSRARTALEKTAQTTKDTASKASRRIADATPAKLKDVAGSAVDAALVPTVQGVVHMLELLNDWVVELTDAEAVLKHHRSKGRDVRSLDDVKALELEHVEEFTRGMVLRWRTLGAGQGASFGALAMIPVPGLGSVAAITLDMVAMQVLSGAIATRVCYAYGFDAADPDMRHMIDRMVGRAYRSQVAKAGAVKQAGAAFHAAKGRVNWSKKLREDHRLLAAVENLMKRLGDGGRVPVKNARMGMPLVAIFAGAGGNAHVLGDIAKQARHYAATMLLAEKYGLELPSNLRRALDSGESTDSADER